jgi:DNA-binding SARP family transcriptional activator/tetratricopeptide (TPR) repeat protein
VLRVRLVGHVAAEVDGRTVAEPPSRRAWALLSWLALHPGLHPRGDVAARLWPDVVDASARQSMRSALWSLRQSLDEFDAGALLTTRDRIGLREDTVVDVHEFRHLVAQDRLAEALRIGDGTLLVGVDDEWALLARDEHRQQLLAVLARLADRAEPARALDWARRAVAIDPLSEEAVRGLMQLLAAADDRPSALAEYRKFADRLRRELRLSPSEETWRLAERIRTAVPATPAIPSRPGVLPMVGRATELRALLAAWTAAEAGHGGLAVVHGEPGVGKTRLVTQLAELASTANAGVATGGTPEVVGPPLAPWAEIAGTLLRGLDPLPDAPWVAALAPLVPAHVPAVAELLPPDMRQARLAEAVVALIEAASASGPLLVLLEDVHAADDATLGMLAHVARRLPEWRVLLVVTRRERPLRDQLAALEYASWQRGTVRADIGLKPLDDTAVAELARTVAPLADDLVARVVAAADGNPLFAVESARALVAGDALPAGLRGAARAATARLDPDGREFVRTLAVAGRDLGLTEAVAWAGVPRRAVAAAEDEGLIECVGDRVRFRHALLREAVYADLPSAERAERHVATAERLADAPARAAERAAHLRSAGRLSEAGSILLLAAAQARAVAALTEATQLLELACGARPDDPEAALALADVLAWRGRSDDCRVAYDRAVALFEQRSDAEALATAHLRFAEWHYGPICRPAVAVEACRRALAVMDGAGVDRPDLRAEILSVYAWCESIAGDLDAVEEGLARLRALVGDEPADPALASVAHGSRCFALLRGGRFAEAIEPGVRASDAGARAGRPDLMYGGLVNAAFGAAVTGDLQYALELLDRAVVAVRGNGIPAIEALVLVDRAWVLTRLGRLRDAVEAAGLARTIADRLDAPDLQALVDAERGRVALRAGDHASAVDLLGAALAAGEVRISRPLARLQRAEALARSGRLDEAERELADAVFEPVRTGDWPDTLVARMSAVEGLIAEGHGEMQLAQQRLTEAADGWRRRMSPAELGRQLGAVMVDLGRPIIGLVVPSEELAVVESDLASLLARTEG